MNGSYTGGGGFGASAGVETLAAQQKQAYVDRQQDKSETQIQAYIRRINSLSSSLANGRNRVFVVNCLIHGAQPNNAAGEEPKSVLGSVDPENIDQAIGQLAMSVELLLQEIHKLQS